MNRPSVVMENFCDKPGNGYFWREGNWWTYRGIDFSKAMEKGAEAFGWKDKWQGLGEPTAVNGTKKRGVGVGVHSHADVGEDSSEAMVNLTPPDTLVNPFEFGLMGSRGTISSSMTSYTRR